jgi:hypothetical protein
MPANKEYLDHNKTQRIVKLTAAFLGSFLVAASSMLAVASRVHRPKVVFMTYNYALILIWCGLMLLAFLFKQAWKCWLLYGLLTLVFVVAYLIRQ